MANTFKTSWNISELLAFLRANPLGFKVYKGEKQLANDCDYIFLDLTGYTPITFDDGGLHKADITVNVYSRTFLNRQKIVEYLNTRLFGTVYLRKDDADFVATLERSIFLDETK